MKERTIQDLHDRDIGHKKFAQVCDILIEKGYAITHIKEFYQKFKFEIDGFPFEYDKNWKSSAKAYAVYFINLLDAKKHINKLWRY